MRIMLAGHMDEIGFIVHHISDEGLLYFSGIGGHDSTIPIGQRVWIHGKDLHSRHHWPEGSSPA